MTTVSEVSELSAVREPEQVREPQAERAAVRARQEQRVLPAEH